MSSPFASQHTRTVSLPSDPDQSVTIRRLSGRQLEKAAQEHFFRSTETVKRIGGPKFQKEMQDALEDTSGKAEVETAKKDPLNGYDLRTLLYNGIVSWTYPEPLTVVVVNGKECIPAIDDLTDDAEDFLARKILRLAKPSLFLTEPEAEAAEKNA